MYKDSKRTCIAIVLLMIIKSFVWRSSRRRHRRCLLKLPSIKSLQDGAIHYLPPEWPEGPLLADVERTISLDFGWTHFKLKQALSCSSVR